MKRTLILDLLIVILIVSVIGVVIFLLNTLKIIDLSSAINHNLSKLTPAKVTPTPEPATPAFTGEFVKATIDVVNLPKLYVTFSNTNKKYVVNVTKETSYSISSSLPVIPNIKPIEISEASSASAFPLTKGQTVVIGTPVSSSKLPNEFTATSITMDASVPTQGMVVSITPNKLQIQKIIIQPDLSGRLTTDYVTYEMDNKTQYALNYNPQPDQYYPISVGQIKASHESELVQVYSQRFNLKTGDPIADIVIVTRAKKID